MLHWLTQHRRMVGGLYFGAPGWAPEQIEDPLAHLAPPASPSAEPPPPAPGSRDALTALLRHIGLARTSAITPGLLEQMEDIGQRDIRALVLDLLPTQPEFALAHALTRSALAEMCEGLAAIQHVVNARRVMLVTDRHDWRTRRLWLRARRAATKSRRRAGLKKLPALFSVHSLLNQYPLAHPTILLRRLFAKRLPVGRLPVRVNHIIVDPVTCWALGAALRPGAAGRRFSQRPVQLFGHAAAGQKHGSARVVMATIGETLCDLCARFNLSTAGMQVIVNGMLAGEEVDPLATRVESCTESVSLREPPLPETSTACFACGWCVDVCPTGLNPVSLFTLAEQAQHFGGQETPLGAAQLRSSAARESLHCIGCGLCSYVCPTRLPLTQRTLRLRGWVVGNQTSRPSIPATQSSPPPSSPPIGGGS